MLHPKVARTPSVRLAAAVIATLAAAHSAVAQEGERTALEEIIVTAQKREQNLQEVPIALSVVSASQLEMASGFNAESLKTLVPSLNIRKTNTALNQAIFLRGVGTINFAIAAQPSVAFVLDGVVLSSAGEAFGDLYDVERVEVLRGPQGTLFGKNSSAGVVNVISKRPSSEFGASVELGWFEDDEYRIKASLDAPISDRLRTRTSVAWGDFDGYIDNISATPAGGKLNGYERYGIRSIWVADPSDAVQLTFIGDYRKSDDNCCVEVIGNAPGGANGPALQSILSGTDFRGDATRQVKQDLVMTSEEEAWGLSLQADIDLWGGTLTSITAYRTWDSTEIREGDWLDRVAAYPGNAFALLHDTGPQTTETFSQELRFTGSAGKLDYVAGLYYSSTDAERYFRRDTTVCRSTTSSPDATGLAPCLPGTSVVESQFADADFSADFENLALFADGTYNVSDRWRLIGGLRWTQDDLSFDHLYNFSPRPGPGIKDRSHFDCLNACTSLLLTGSDKSDEVSGRAGLQFDVTPAFMTYATYSRGYKGPAFNVFFNMTSRQTGVIDAETVDAYEVGFKSTLFGGKAIINGAAFLAEYDNFQANNFLVLNNVTITTLTNAGEVETEGFELDFLARPTDNFSISGGIAYADATVVQFPVPPGAPPGSQPTVRSGTQLPLAPKLKASLAADYRIRLASMDIVPALIFAYQDESWSDLNEPAALRIPSYSTVDLTISFMDKDDRYRLMLIGRNLGDENYTVLKTSGGPGGVPRLQVPRDADQYFGVQFRANFGGK